MGEAICPVDCGTAGNIRDDDLNALVQQLPQGARLTVIFDSCRSGTALDLPFVYDNEGKPKLQKYSGEGISDNAKFMTVKTHSTEADVIMFSGCNDNQSSTDTGKYGVASHAFITAVRTGGEKTYTELLASMRDICLADQSADNQKMQMSTGFPTNMNVPFIFLLSRGHRAFPCLSPTRPVPALTKSEPFIPA